MASYDEILLFNKRTGATDSFYDDLDEDGRVNRSAAEKARVALVGGWSPEGPLDATHETLPDEQYKYNIVNPQYSDDEENHSQMISSAPGSALMELLKVDGSTRLAEREDYDKWNKANKREDIKERIPGGEAMESLIATAYGLGQGFDPVGGLDWALVKMGGEETKDTLNYLRDEHPWKVLGMEMGVVPMAMALAATAGTGGAAGAAIPAAMAATAARVAAKIAAKRGGKQALKAFKAVGDLAMYETRLIDKAGGKVASLVAGKTSSYADMAANSSVVLNGLSRLANDYAPQMASGFTTGIVYGFGQAHKQNILGDPSEASAALYASAGGLGGVLGAGLGGLVVKIGKNKIRTDKLKEIHTRIFYDSALGEIRKSAPRNTPTRKAVEKVIKMAGAGDGKISAKALNALKAKDGSELANIKSMLLDSKFGREHGLSGPILDGPVTTLEKAMERVETVMRVAQKKLNSSLERVAEIHIESSVGSRVVTEGVTYPHAPSPGEGLSPPIPSKYTSGPDRRSWESVAETQYDARIAHTADQEVSQIPEIFQMDNVIHKFEQEAKAELVLSSWKGIKEGRRGAPVWREEASIPRAPGRVGADVEPGGAPIEYVIDLRGSKVGSKHKGRSLYQEDMGEELKLIDDIVEKMNRERYGDFSAMNSFKRELSKSADYSPQQWHQGVSKESGKRRSDIHKKATSLVREELEYKLKSTLNKAVNNGTLVPGGNRAAQIAEAERILRHYDQGNKTYELLKVWHEAAFSMGPQTIGGFRKGMGGLISKHWPMALGISQFYQGSGALKALAFYGIAGLLNSTRKSTPVHHASKLLGNYWRRGIFYGKKMLGLTGSSIMESQQKAFKTLSQMRDYTYKVTGEAIRKSPRTVVPKLSGLLAYEVWGGKKIPKSERDKEVTEEQAYIDNYREITNAARQPEKVAALIKNSLDPLSDVSEELTDIMTIQATADLEFLGGLLTKNVDYMGNPKPTTQEKHKLFTAINIFNDIDIVYERLAEGTLDTFSAMVFRERRPIDFERLNKAIVDELPRVGKDGKMFVEILTLGQRQSIENLTGMIMGPAPIGQLTASIQGMVFNPEEETPAKLRAAGTGMIGQSGFNQVALRKENANAPV